MACARRSPPWLIWPKAELPQFGEVFVPPLIIALAIGMALQPLSGRPALKAGIEFSGRTLLRVGVALYGARLTLGNLVDGGACRC